MLQPPKFLAGPWRAVPVLAVTQILAWGTIYYPIALTAPIIAADHDWSKAYAMAGFSTGLLVSGMASSQVGRLIDRYGGHRVMSVGSLMGATGLLGLGFGNGSALYFLTWIALGFAMSASLYNSSFATLGRIFGDAARRPITVLTVIGGITSTISWPSTHALIDAVGWRNTYFIYASLLMFVAAPLHWRALPRDRASSERVHVPKAQTSSAPLLPPRGLPFVLVAGGFSSFSFMFSGFLANFLSIFSRLGLDAGTAIMISTLIGPSQMAARFGEFAIARNAHPLQIVRTVLSLLVLGYVLLALLGVSITTSVALAISYGVANGLMTIATATVPLALFGSAAYGTLIGRLGGPPLLMQSAAPFVVAFVAERASDRLALAVLAAFAALSLVCFLGVRRPQP
jgi:MFS family permease